MNNTTTPEEAEYKEAQDYEPSAFVVPLAQFLEMKQQRDEARELLESEKITRNHIIQRGIEMQKERDEAREDAKRWQELCKTISPY